MEFIRLELQKDVVLGNTKNGKVVRHCTASRESIYAERIEMSAHNSSDVASLGNLDNLEVEINSVGETCAQVSNFKPLIKAVGQYVVFAFNHCFIYLVKYLMKLISLWNV